MKLYTNFSPSHRCLYENYFLKSLPKGEFELIIEENPQKCESGNWYQPGWEESCIMKSEFVLKACKESMGEIFVFSDVDVQFFG